jgi:hypothetical protein
MITALLKALVRFIQDSLSPFFLLPAADAFMKSIMMLFLFGAIIRVVALFSVGALFKAVMSLCAYGVLLRLLLLI